MQAYRREAIMAKVVHLVVAGKRRKSIARAGITNGTGKVRINKIAVANFGSRMENLKIQEAILLAGDKMAKYDIDVMVHGGGPVSQADAVRLAIARAVVQFSKDRKLEKAYLDYDRAMLVADVRHREARKPNRHGNARGKVQKSYR